MIKRIFSTVLLATFILLPAYAAHPFHEHRYDLFSVLPVHSGDIVFLGNSITNMHEWQEAFGGENNILGRGVSGCISDETLESLEPVISGHPSKVFLMVGTNDLARKGLDDPYRILRNTDAIVAAFREGSPETEVYIQSVLPVAEGNSRKAEDIMTLNGLLKDLCGRTGAHYVDLWSKLVEPGTTHINPHHTADGLHLHPSGYKIWCDAIAPLVGRECVYPDAPNNNFSLPGSLGMRAAAFAVQNIGKDDIVLIGDEMVHSGEWHELLSSANVKNRGTGWGFGEVTIDVIARGIPAIFHSGTAPAQIFLHAGSAEVARGVSPEKIETSYRTLVESVKAAAPGSRLFLMSVCPVYDAWGKVSNQNEVNARIKVIAEESGATFVDINSALSIDGRPNPEFVRNNYVTGKGYLAIAGILATYTGLKPVPAMFVTGEQSFTGRGNADEPLLTLTVAPEKRIRIRKLAVRLHAAPGDVSALKVISGGKVLGSVKVKPGKTEYKIPCRIRVSSLTDIKLCADIGGNATEGAKVSAEILKVKTGWFRWREAPSRKACCREILLRRTRLFGPGDYGSRGWRIPAIVTLKDGTLLTATDKRKNNELDLPADIDIVARRSEDGGTTWSAPVMIAEGRGADCGFGDAALVVTSSDDVICAYSGGAGLWNSTPENPQRNYIVRSVDGGRTWSEPYDCTARLWGAKADNASCRSFHSAFFASGRGLCLTQGKYAGRIIFIAAVHSKELGRFDNYAFYSDDGGLSWKVSGCAFKGGDEAKAVELPDGRVLLSVRRHGERGFNLSSDGGRTWGEQGTWPEIDVTACNGDIVRVGDLLLQSTPNADSRRNVSIFASRDNGVTWPYVKTICPYESVYSSFTELADGTIGVYLEENPQGEFELWYENFSPDWLLSHSDREKYLSTLYDTMPLPDSLVFPKEWWEKNVEKTLEVRSTMRWGVPEREFVHFVLPLRVNNESLDDFRTVYADSLCARVRGLDMYNAVLEINRWCHERVTYRPSDGRTSAPMSTIRYGYGRCGEESVLTVAALRAAGIPARQVYTPRWAHTDDNHAWVEAWVDGKWHFLGACEPEPALDMGWFSAPVSRAMLLHTNVYGDYKGGEDVIQKNRLYTEINVIRNYVPARRTEVRVLDDKGRPVKGATVEFRIYNYAELYKVARCLSDRKGLTALDTGLGDIMVWAYKGDRFGFAKAGSEHNDVVLNHTFGEDVSLDFHIVPPPENPIPAYASEAQIAENAARLKVEDAIRAKMHPGVVNSGVINAFRNSAKGNPTREAAVKTVLGGISAKDFRDITYDVLEDAVSDLSDTGRYVLSPRVELERLLPFRAEMRSALKDSIRSYAQALEWVKANIRIVEGRNPLNLRIPPIAVWRGRVCDRYSLGIFYVALCRSVGIPARVSPEDGSIQVMDAGRWLKVDMEESSARTTAVGKLRLNTDKCELTSTPEYFRHFSISRIDDGNIRLMDYEYSEQQPGYDFTLEEGWYLLTSGTRLPDGSVLCHLHTFNIKEGDEAVEELVLPSAEKNNAKAGAGSYIEAVLKENGEPVTHALRQLESIAEVLNTWGGEIRLFGPTDKSLDFFRTFIKSVKNVSYHIDEESKERDSIAESCGGDVNFLPFVVIRDGDGKVLYFSQGYNTSLGEGLTQIIK